MKKLMKKWIKKWTKNRTKKSNQKNRIKKWIKKSNQKGIPLKAMHRQISVTRKYSLPCFNFTKYTIFVLIFLHLIFFIVMFFCAIFHPIKTVVINEQKSSNFSSEDFKSKDENSMNGSSKDLKSKTMELDLDQLKNERNKMGNESNENVNEMNQSSLQKKLLITTHGANISLTLLTLLGIWRENLHFVTFSMMVSLITLVSFTINFDLITSLEIVAELSFFLLCLLFVISTRIKREYYNYDEREQENVDESRDTVVVPFSD